MKNIKLFLSMLMLLTFCGSVFADNYNYGTQRECANALHKYANIASELGEKKSEEWLEWSNMESYFSNLALTTGKSEASCSGATCTAKVNANCSLVGTGAGEQSKAAWDKVIVPKLKAEVEVYLKKEKFDPNADTEQRRLTCSCKAPCKNIMIDVDWNSCRL